MLVPYCSYKLIPLHLLVSISKTKRYTTEYVQHNDISYTFTYTPLSLTSTRHRVITIPISPNDLFKVKNIKTIRYSCTMFQNINLHSETQIVLISYLMTIPPHCPFNKFNHLKKNHDKTRELFSSLPIEKLR